MPTFNEGEQVKRLEELRGKEEEDLANILSQKYGVSYADLTRTPINTDALQLVGEETARAGETAVFDRIGKKVSVAVRSPQNAKSEEIIHSLKERGYLPSLFMVSKASLEHAWGRYRDLSFAVETKKGILDISGEEIQALIDQLKTLDDSRAIITETLAMKKAYRISRIVEVVLAGALSSNASDVHIEPEEEYVRLRYRLDGVLTDIINFDQETYALILARIKLTSGLKLNVKNKAQDGRFSVRIDQKEIEIRTSILPGAQGESIVLRLLDPNTLTIPLKELGVEEKLYEILEKEIRRPNGMILTTGPTGAGKTTTLYAFMREIHTPKIKIITIEDPVEYKLPGIVQTQVDHKDYTFEKGLRSALRQDPDVIMVGEIRDREVAETAINSALTGHLVFSTLHTNNAAGAFPRLIDLGVNPKVISSAVNVVMAQRLLRKLCPACKKEVVISGKQKDIIEKITAGIVDRKLVPENRERAWEEAGCAECNGTGFKGRIGIYEAILLDSTIEKLVEESAGEREIAAGARTQGILSMREDGILKILRGVTSLSELARVVDLEDNRDSAPISNS